MENANKTIIKIQKRENPYLQIDKQCINDKRLSWKAKGILAYLLSKPDDWQVYLGDLLKKAKDGKSALRAGFRELEKYFYVVKGKRRGTGGKFEGWEYLVYEEPRCENRTSVSTEVRKSDVGKSDFGKSDTTNKEGTNKERTKTNATAVAFALKDYLDEMKRDQNRHIQIIATWIEAKGLTPDSREQIQSIVKRNLRAARLLVGYKDDDIKDTVRIIKNTEWIRKFTLETVLKFIDEAVAQKIKRGPRWRSPESQGSRRVSKKTHAPRAQIWQRG